MVYIDDAGTGAILGTPLVVGIKDGKVEKVFFENPSSSKATKETFELLEKLKVEKDEEIHICRGLVFDGFCHEAKQKGYTNIIREAMVGDIQEVAENSFMGSLYDLGVAKDMKLKGKDYEDFHNNLLSAIVLNPTLLQYVRPHYLQKHTYTKLIYWLSRLQDEFPHLYSEIKGC